MVMQHHEYEYEQDEWQERVDMFADPGGHSALRRADRNNPRNLPCPTCHRENMLTPADVARRQVPVRLLC